MNVGSIPGYYFDEDKKKYFKIQADHVLPTGAKHSRSNVKHEKAATKKRKLESLFRTQQAAQTIRRSKILSDPAYGGIGLCRELGTQLRGLRRLHADQAHVAQLTCQNVPFQLRTLHSAYPSHSTGRTMFAGSSPGTNTQDHPRAALYDFPWDVDQRLNPRWLAPHLTSEPHDQADWIFFSATSILSTSCYPAVDPEILVTVTDSETSNVYLQYLHDEIPNVLFAMGTSDEPVWDCAIEPWTGASVAFAATDRVLKISFAPSDRRHLEDCDGIRVAEDDAPRNTRCVEWLDPSVIVAGAGSSVLLWDTRARDTRTRFHHGAQITGLQTVPGSAGTQMVVSSNHRLALYDTRMSAKHDDRALVSFPTLHENTKLVLSTSARGLIAAATQVGSDEKVQIFSLLSGRQMRTLDLPGRKGARVTQLQWREDDLGAEYLQGCAGNRLVKWGWEDVAEEVETADEYISSVLQRNGQR